MAPVATTFFFYFLSALTVLSGVLVITRKNPVHSALALIMSLLGQAALYLMLYAPFVAGVQIILYAGGIMVLFLFVIMLVNIREENVQIYTRQYLAGVLIVFLLGFGLLAAVLQAQYTNFFRTQDLKPKSAAESIAYSIVRYAPASVRRPFDQFPFQPIRYRPVPVKVLPSTGTDQLMSCTS